MANSENTPHQPSSGGKVPAWHATLSKYRDPSDLKAAWQLLNTLLPYGVFWSLAILSIRRGYPNALTFILMFIAATFFVRIFVLFHDCAHGSLFRTNFANTFFGHALGVLVFTPFADWRFSHLRHHASYAKLDARGFGDIWTMTVTEYRSAPKRTQLAYRLYRNPFVLIGLGALFAFMLRYRLPGRKTTLNETMSVLFTNLLILAVALIMGRYFGWGTYLLIQVPVVWMAGAMGIWVFYVQHQFKGVYWAGKGEWDPMRAALEGSSFYKLPGLLRWFTGDIGYHHVHHLRPRIPNYRLKACYEGIPELQIKEPLTFRKSLSSIHLKIWDEERKELVGFPQNA